MPGEIYTAGKNFTLPPVVTNFTSANRYEAGTGGQKYEAFKLSPFHGYLCSDSNVPDQPDYCQDMKVGLGADNVSHDVVWNKGTLFWMSFRLRRKNTLPSFVICLFVRHLFSRSSKSHVLKGALLLCEKLAGPVVRLAGVVQVLRLLWGRGEINYLPNFLLWE